MGVFGTITFPPCPIAFSNMAIVIAWGIFVAFKQRVRNISPGILALTSLLATVPILPWLISLLNHPEFNDYYDTLLQYTIMTRSEGLFYYFKELPLKLLPATPFFF